jgi:hypothetical protein
MPACYHIAMAEQTWLSQPDTKGWLYQVQFNWDGTKGGAVFGGWVVFVLKRGNFVETEGVKDTFLKNSLYLWRDAPALYEHFSAQGVTQSIPHWSALTIYIAGIDASFKLVMEGVYSQSEMEEKVAKLPLKEMVEGMKE